MCVHPCPYYLTGGHTHVLCLACLGWSGLSPLCHQQIWRWRWSCVWLYSHACTGSAGVGWERCLEEHQCWGPGEMRYCCPFWPPDFCLSGSSGPSCTRRSVQSQSLELRNQCGRHYGVKCWTIIHEQHPHIGVLIFPGGREQCAGWRQ